MPSQSPLDGLDDIAEYSLAVAKAALRAGQPVIPFALVMDAITVAVIQLFDFTQRVDVLRKAVERYQARAFVVVFGGPGSLHVRAVSERTDLAGSCKFSVQNPLIPLAFSDTVWATPRPDEFSPLRALLTGNAEIAPYHTVPATVM